MVLERVREAAWDKLVHYEMVPDTRVIATHLLSNGSQVVTYSDDFYSTSKVISHDAFGFHQSQSHLFLLVRPDQWSQGYDMDIQTAFTDVSNPVEVVLPLEDATKHTFTVLESNED
jgi:hypothetical protein